MNHVSPPGSPSAKPTVTTGPLPASKKIYKSGVQHPDIRVPMREIELHPTANEPPVTVYDCSGPYSDPAIKTDIAMGLPRIREPWITARGDVEQYEGRPVTAADNGFVSEDKKAPEFPNLQRPYRAKHLPPATP